MRRLLLLLIVCWLAPLVLAQSANLTLTSVGAQPAAPGLNAFLHAAYYVTGSVDASDVKLTITIPPGAKYVGDTVPAFFQCTEPPKGGQGDLVCTAAHLPAGTNDAVQAEVTVDPSTTPGTVIVFPVTLTAPTAVKPSQSLSANLTVVATADLTTTLSSPSTVVPGDTFTSVVTVTNNGPGNALNTQVLFTRQYPGVYLQSASGPPGWTCGSGGGFVCSISSFPPGTATFTFTEFLLVNFKAGTFTQKAWADTFVDPNDSDNVATSTTTIVMPPLTEVSVDLTASPDLVKTGDTLTYTAKIANKGSVDARNVFLTLGVQGRVLTTTCGTPDALHCSFPTIAAGATQTATVTMRVDAGPGSQLGAYASLLGANLSNGDPMSTVTTTVHVTPRADLQLRMTAPPSIQAGGEGVWSCFVSNTGPDAANDWTLTFPLPSNVTFGGGITVTGQANCDAIPLQSSNVTVTCRGTALPFQLDLGLVVDPSATGVHATATVASSDVNDPNPDNNSASADTVITLITPPIRRRAARH